MGGGVEVVEAGLPVVWVTLDKVCDRPSGRFPLYLLFVESFELRRDGGPVFGREGAGDGVGAGWGYLLQEFLELLFLAQAVGGIYVDCNAQFGEPYVVGAGEVGCEPHGPDEAGVVGAPGPPGLVESAVGVLPDLEGDAGPVAFPDTGAPGSDDHEPFIAGPGLQGGVVVCGECGGGVGVGEVRWGVVGVAAAWCWVGVGHVWVSLMFGLGKLSSGWRRPTC